MLAHSLEITHLYAGRGVSETETRCAELAAGLELRGPTQRVVMIDDYHSRGGEWLSASAGIPITADGFYSEAALSGLAPGLLRETQERAEARSAYRYRASRGIWPCSALTAVWLALRLGVVRAPAGLTLRGAGLEPAERLTSVLAESCRRSEERAIKILYGISPGLSQRVETLWVCEGGSARRARAACEAAQ